VSTPQEPLLVEPVPVPSREAVPAKLGWLLPISMPWPVAVEFGWRGHGSFCPAWPSGMSVQANQHARSEVFCLARKLPTRVDFRRLVNSRVKLTLRIRRWGVIPY